MRFTVKAKLACAFGVVIVLSAVAGGVAYMRLSDTIATSEAIVARAGRMERATELEKNVLLQVRAEKNTLAVSGAELDQFIAEVGKIREATSKTRDEIDATASEDGKKLIASFSTAYTKMNT
jgi:methyl-accepting chemotaxis protein